MNAEHSFDTQIPPVFLDNENPPENYSSAKRVDFWMSPIFVDNLILSKYLTSPFVTVSRLL